MNKLKQNNAITLIALIITIIVLLILAGVVLNMTIGNNGIIQKSQMAVEEYKISAYQEKINLILTELYAQNDGKYPTLEQIKDRIETENWVLETEIVTDDGKEKLKVTTKEGYVFLVTQRGVEYKNTEKGVAEEVKIGDNLVVDVADTNTSDLKRKTNIKLDDLFDITWETDGKGTVGYTISGNLWFNNTTYDGTVVNNVSDLELGTYTITCTATAPSGKTANNTKQVVIQNLANTDASTYAIYSGYDLAYFRDLVNGGQTSINAEQMNNIDLSAVCSETIGSWIPIAYYGKYYFGTYNGKNYEITGLYLNNTEEKRVALFAALGYGGNIKNLTLNGSVKSTSVDTPTGGIVGRNEGIIENCTNKASIECCAYAGGISGMNYNTIKNCKNYGTIKSVENQKSVYLGGIAADSGEGGIIINSVSEHNVNKIVIEDCINYGIINKNDNIDTNGVFIGAGGIIGYAENVVEITGCKNKGTVTCTDRGVGGIIGIAHGTIINRCSNTGDISSTGSGWVGGILGVGTGTVSKCYNMNCNIEAFYYGVGGIVGRSMGCTISNCYNVLGESNYIRSTDGGNVGGLVGVFNTALSVLENSYTIGNNIIANGLGETGYSDGAILGINNIANSEVKNCWYLSTVQPVGYESVNLKTKDTHEITNNTTMSNLVTALNNTSSTWTTENDKNNGYPILANNKPEAD